MATPAQKYRFAQFELDLGAYELRKDGRQVRLERRPMDLLILLVEHHHELVSRDDIVGRLWGEGVFVDVDTGVNTAIRKVRNALNDSTRSTGFVETVSGKGYRFVGPVEIVEPSERHRRGATLAVLPFENLGAGIERDYIADGFTEEAITAIGQIDPDISVIGRTSVMAYKATRKSLAEIGRELGATYLVEGSMRTEGGRWRVTAKLIRVPEQVQVWSAVYDGEPRSMLEFQQELSSAIAQQIRVRLSPGHFATLQRRQSRSAEAYDLYLRGRHLWNQFTPQTNRSAIEHYARATQLDASYALAWSGIADALGSSPINADACPDDVVARSRECALRAVQNDPGLPETQTTVGLVNYWFDWNWPAAEIAYRRAIAFDASYSLAHRMLGILLGSAGRYAEAREAMSRARELDPLQAMNHALSAHVAFLGHEYIEGMTHAQRAIAIAPNFWIGHFQLALLLEQTGDGDGALRSLRDAERSTPGNSKMLSLRGYILARLGRRNEALSDVEMLRSIDREPFVTP
jgi:TolB-like protein